MAATGERFDPRKLAGQARDLLTGRKSEPAVTPTPVEKPRFVLTEASEIGGHKFEVEEFESVRLFRVIQPWGGLVGGEPLASEYEGMTPEEIALKLPSGRADGYYTFTRVSGTLVVDGGGTRGGWGRGERFSLEVQQSPRTFLGGTVVNYRDLLDDKGWGEAAKRNLDKGIEQGVMFECSKERPYARGLYPLQPGDRAIARPKQSQRPY